jgi:hypothetical protein
VLIPVCRGDNNLPIGLPNFAIASRSPAMTGEGSSSSIPGASGRARVSVECEHGLRIKGMRYPGCAVLIECGDPVFRRDVIRPSLLCYLCDEPDDALLGRPVVPGREGVGFSVSPNAGGHKHCQENQKMAESNMYSLVSA